MRRLLAMFGSLSLLYACSGAGYIPYSSRSLAPSEIRSLVNGASAETGVPQALVNAVLMAESAGETLETAKARSLGGYRPSETNHSQSCQSNSILINFHYALGLHIPASHLHSL